MLQQDEPEDYVVATGETHSIMDLIEVAFGHLDLDWKDYITVDEAFYRPAEIYELKGDCTKATKQLGWKPEVTFRELIEMMVDADMARLREDSQR